MDAIAEQAFCKLLISCAAERCVVVFEGCLDQPAVDPVDRWAEEMAAQARAAGWSADGKQRVLCPEHRQ
jgi:hypothetical protein